MRTPTTLALLLLEERDALITLLVTQRALLTGLVADSDGTARPEALQRAVADSNRLRRRMLDRDLEVFALARDRALPADTDLLGVVETTSDPSWRCALETVLDGLERAAADLLDLSDRIADVGPVRGAGACARVHPATYRSRRSGAPGSTTRTGGGW
ncbi:hypothetical protein [Curtobacterium sp. MCBD17_021]|uniref:hypothetical protein n=1 Tax=Curtobacterium sp. MCBD17_021 TaxID=2175665 RepID=UPI0011B48A82|nr:hypothetical protein [Curtobacterium sp. MCBD17_021]